MKLGSNSDRLVVCGRWDFRMDGDERLRSQGRHSGKGAEKKLNEHIHEIGVKPK